MSFTKKTLGRKEGRRGGKGGRKKKFSENSVKMIINKNSERRDPLSKGGWWVVFGTIHREVTVPYLKTISFPVLKILYNGK